MVSPENINYSNDIYIQILLERNIKDTVMLRSQNKSSVSQKVGNQSKKTNVDPVNYNDEEICITCGCWWLIYVVLAAVFE